MADTANLSELDKQYLWHPFTQQRGWEQEEQLFIESAEGSTLYDTDGRAYIDGISSLWCTVHGHRHPTIDAAVVEQLGKVAHTTMLGLSHPPAVELARRLVEIAPAGLSRVFYSESGSTAVEIALKMAFQWWRQRGDKQRTKFVTLTNAYHGDTIGAVSVGGMDLFHSLYRPLLFQSELVQPGDIDALRELLQRQGESIAAVIVEPLVQGAGGMLTQPKGYLRAVRELCDEHGALLICDEVAVGFGRTGRMFACEHEDVSPDFLCLAKGITGGYLPLAATLTTEAIYAGFLGDHSELRTFFHGHTYTGNPLACAAALATLDVFEQERTLERLEEKIELLAELLEAHIAPLDHVSEIRRCGFMTGIELAPFELEDQIGHKVTLAARALGAIVRPLGNVIVLMPPLSIEAAELRRLVEITARAITEVVGAAHPVERAAAATA